jgi:hypothetical protein
MVQEIQFKIGAIKKSRPRGNELQGYDKAMSWMARVNATARPAAGCDRRKQGCYTARMFARKLRIDVVIGGVLRPCPLEWLDRFLMRNFTGAAEFDDALPVADGRAETGLRIDPHRLADALEEWLVKTGKTSGKPVKVEVTEEPLARAGCENRAPL